MNLDTIIKIIGSGIDQTNILLTLAILDTILGISWRLKVGHALISNRFMSGVTRNFVPALLPALLHYMRVLIKSTAPVYQYAACLIFLTSTYFLIQSILSNLSELGTPLPNWIIKCIENELNEKGLK